MAAHIVTALAQLSKEINDELDGKGNISWDGIKAALVISSWTEDLDENPDARDWGDLYEIVHDPDCGVWDLYEWIEAVAPKYLARWYELGLPASREEWHKARRK